MIADPLPLMKRYLGGGEDLTNDEREILLFALYMESLQRNDGIASLARGVLVAEDDEKSPKCSLCKTPCEYKFNSGDPKWVCRAENCRKIQ